MQVKKRILSLVLCLCLVCGVYVPQSAEKVEAAATISTVTGNRNEALIFSYLTEKMGLNSAAACGILANVYRECRFNEKAAGTASYGICQWYNGNFTRLKDYCERNGYDYRTLSAQLYFLNYDLQQRFGKLLTSLKSVPNTAEGAYKAAYDFCYNYERPQSYKTASVSRGELAQTEFWPVFGGQRLIMELDSATHIHTMKTVTNKASLAADGSIVKVCSECGYEEQSQIINRIAKVTLSDTSFVYNGKTRKPSVKVTDSQGNRISSSYYSVTYSGKCKSVGKYKVTVKFKGSYSGQKVLTFQIVPKGTTLKSVTGKKKSLYVKWSKNKTQTTGYQIQYSTNATFTGSNVKSVTVKNSTTAKTLSKLSAKKRYYVRIRTYKSLKYEGKTIKLYSSWSKAKNAVTRK